MSSVINYFKKFFIAETEESPTPDADETVTISARPANESGRNPPRTHAPTPLQKTQLQSFFSSTYEISKALFKKKKKVVVFLSSVQPNRKAIRVCEFLKNEMESYDLTPVVFDPKEILEFMLQTSDEAELEDSTASPPWLDKLNNEIKQAAGLLVLVPEYEDDEPLPAALTNMLDLFPPVSFAFKACGLVAYSRGVYYADCRLRKLRTFLLDLGITPLPCNVILPNVEACFDENGNSTNEKAGTSVHKLLKDFKWCLENVNLRVDMLTHIGVKKGPENTEKAEQSSEGNH